MQMIHATIVIKRFYFISTNNCICLCLHFRMPNNAQHLSAYLRSFQKLFRFYFGHRKCASFLFWLSFNLLLLLRAIIFFLRMFSFLDSNFTSFIQSCKMRVCIISLLKNISLDFTYVTFDSNGDALELDGIFRSLFTSRYRNRLI